MTTITMIMFPVTMAIVSLSLCGHRYYRLAWRALIAWTKISWSRL